MTCRSSHCFNYNRTSSKCKHFLRNNCIHSSKSLCYKIVTKQDIFHFLLIRNARLLSFKRCSVCCADDLPALCPDFARASEHGETAGANLRESGVKRGGNMAESQPKDCRRSHRTGPDSKSEPIEAPLLRVEGGIEEAITPQAPTGLVSHNPLRHVYGFY